MINPDVHFSRIERLAWLLGRWLQDWAEGREADRRWRREQ